MPSSKRDLDNSRDAPRGSYFRHHIQGMLNTASSSTVGTSACAFAHSIQVGLVRSSILLEKLPSSPWNFDHHCNMPRGSYFRHPTQGALDTASSFYSWHGFLYLCQLDPRKSGAVFYHSRVDTVVDLEFRSPAQCAARNLHPPSHARNA